MTVAQTLFAVYAQMIEHRVKSAMFGYTHKMNLASGLHDGQIVSLCVICDECKRAGH